MKIIILAVGKARTDHLDDAIREYEKRLSRWTKISWNIIPTSNKRTESEALLRALPKDAYVILLDERGKQWATTDLSEQLEKMQNEGRQSVVFIIGGAHGAEQMIRDRANHIWSLSELVFPHEMVRLILIEQLYRAHDLNHGGKYHHS